MPSKKGGRKAFEYISGQPVKTIRARQRKRGHKASPRQRGGGGTRG